MISIHCNLNVNLSAIKELISLYSDAIDAYDRKVKSAFVNFHK